MNIKRNESLYLFGICIMIFSELLGKTVLYEYSVTSTICNIMRYVIAFPVVLIVFWWESKMAYRTFIVSVFAIIIIFMNIFFANEKRLILIALYIIAGRNIKLEKIIKIAFITTAAVFLSTIILSTVGILDNIIYTQQQGLRIRNSLGFKYSSYAGNILLHLTCMYIFIKKNTFNITHGVFIFIANGIIYHLTDTNFAFACTILAITLAIIINYCSWFKIFNHFFWLINKHICWSSAFISIITSIIYTSNNSILEKLNILLNQRLRLGHNAIYNYEIHFMGNYFELIGPVEILNNNSLVYNYVDSSYVQILLKYGIIFLFLLIFIITLFCFKICKVKEYYLAIAMIIILFHSMLEPQLLDIGYNPFIFGLGIILQKNNYSYLYQKLIFPLKKCRFNNI